MRYIFNVENVVESQVELMGDSVNSTCALVTFSTLKLYFIFQQLVEVKCLGKRIFFSLLHTANRLDAIF